MLKPDRHTFLGASLGLTAQRLWRACYSYSAEGPDGSLLQSNQHSSAFVTAKLTEETEEEERRKLEDVRSWIRLGLCFHD